MEPIARLKAMFAAASAAVLFRVGKLRPLFNMSVERSNGHHIDNGFANGKSERSVPLTWLPEAAPPLASQYACRFHLQQLEEPLEQFLLEATRVPGLRGVGLAAWEIPKFTPMLRIYALTDFTKRGTPEDPTPDVLVTKLYDQFSRQVRAFDNRPLDVALEFIYADEGSVADIAKRFPREMHEALLGAHPPKMSDSLYTVAGIAA